MIHFYTSPSRGKAGWFPISTGLPEWFRPCRSWGNISCITATTSCRRAALGRLSAERFRGELVMDNLGMCRFHRAWAEEMLPEIVGKLFGMKQEYLDRIAATASRINSRNSSIFWESERNIDFVHSFLKRKHEVEGDSHPELLAWLDKFQKDKREAPWSIGMKSTRESMSRCASFYNVGWKKA